MSTPKPSQQISVVEFGHITLVLPAAKAIDLVKLLQSGAFQGQWNYSGISAREPMKLKCSPLGEIRLTTISHEQLQDADIQPAKSRTLRQRLQIANGDGN